MQQNKGQAGMDFSRRIYGYCERGFYPGPGADAFWAEPINAITNLAFIMAAVLGLIVALSARRMDGPVSWLILLTFCVGVGSFMFHTYAVVWAAMTDTIPIMLFILSYFAISMRCFGGFGWFRSLALMLSFLVLLLATSTVLRMGIETPSFVWEALTDRANENWARTAGGMAVGLILAVLAAWFVGRSLMRAGALATTGVLAIWMVLMAGLSEAAMATAPLFFPGARSYLPALLALLGVGAWLSWRGHPAGRWLIAVGGVFALSLTARALDRPLCANFLIGTHWVWHMLNGIVLGSLIIALVRHGNRVEGARAPA